MTKLAIIISLPLGVEIGCGVGHVTQAVQPATLPVNFQTWTSGRELIFLSGPKL